VKYTLLAIPFATLALLTGCGGSSSGGDNAPAAPPPPPPPAAPTVTVTAPATAGFEAFDVSWASTDATSCSSTDLTGVSATSGSVTLTAQAVGSHTYTVTCTGVGGSTNGSAVTVVSVPATFTAGTQTYTIDAVTDPVSSGGFGATVSSVPDPVIFNNGGNAWSIAPSAANPLAPAALAGEFNFGNYSLTVTIPAPLNGVVTLNYTNHILQITPGPGYAVTYDDTTDPAHPKLTATGVLFTDIGGATQCSDNQSGAYCSFVPGSSVPTTGDITITYDDATLTTYTGVANTHQVAIDNDEDTDGDGDPATNPVVICVADGGTDACANGVLTFTGATL
jgi:hypothetical protein